VRRKACARRAGPRSRPGSEADRAGCSRPGERRLTSRGRSRASVPGRTWPVHEAARPHRDDESGRRSTEVLRAGWTVTGCPRDYEMRRSHEHVRAQPPRTPTTKSLPAAVVSLALSTLYIKKTASNSFNVV